MEKTIKEFAEQHKITMEFEQIENRPDDNSEWGKGSRHYKCVLHYEDRDMTIYYSQGSGIKDDPEVEDILNCLIVDNTEYYNSFEEWASEFGYDEDSRKAEKIYNACITETALAKILLGDDLYSELLECETL